MPIPTIHKREDRHAGLKEFDRVQYIHFHPETGKPIIPKDHDGLTLHRGIVEIFGPKSRLNKMGKPEACYGEMVIRVLDRWGRPAWYERLTHIPPMHEMKMHKARMKDPEPRRWFKEDEIPTDAS